jgi:acetyltransferase
VLRPWAVEREAKMTIRNLNKMFEPRSAALIGASGKPGSVGFTAARNMISGGFQGPIYFVNPARAQILDRPCFPDIESLPEAPDLALVATPPQAVPGVIDALGRKGCRAAVVITAGLRGDLSRQMLEAAEPYLLRILGSNCLGLLLPEVRLNASFAHAPARLGDLAFLSQSGAIITSVLDWAADRAVGFSQMVSLGDTDDVDFGDMLDYLAGDVSSRAILLYIESLKNAPKFMSAARRAARSKPVIVIKAGRRAEGARAAASHTGALAGADAVYEAAFRRAGVLRVYDLDEIFDAAEVLSHIGSLPGERLAVLTNGGGAGVLAADALGDYQGRLAVLEESTIAALDKVLPNTWSRGNPVDIIGDAPPQRYRDAMDAMLQDKNTDAILAINCPTALASSLDAAKAVLEAVDARRAQGFVPKPVLTNWLGSSAAEPARKLFEATGAAKKGVASFATPGAAVRGFMQLVRYSRAQEELTRTPPALPDGFAYDAAKVSEMLRRVLAEGRSMLTEPEAKDVLAAYGVPVAATYAAPDPATVALYAARILSRLRADAYKSCVVKILSHDISHKSDVGGVRLDITSPADAEEAAREMLETVRKVAPHARVLGFSVQPMVRKRGAHELIVGVSEDKAFGPVILFGAGGTAVEAIADTALALAPLDLALAHDLMRGARIHRLLKGYRDHEAADLDAIALTLVKVGYLTANHPEIRELDINPLLANSQGVIALDARIVVRDEAADPRTPMSIRPYPRQWEAVRELEGVGRMLLRPVRPDDEPRYEALMLRMTPTDIRLRLFAPVKKFSHKLMARMTQLDYAREIAFAAVAGEPEEFLGVVHLAADPDYIRAEYAVMVRSDLKGHGLGWILMQHAIAYAKAEGLRELNGSVLCENTTMLQMCRELGFQVGADPEDPAVKKVMLDLREA